MKTSILTILFIFISIGVALLVLAGLAFFVVALAMRLSGRGSGWAELAKRYPAENSPVGQEFAWQTVRVGIVRFRHSARVIVAPEGLWLSMQLQLAKFPPLFIPWEEVKGVQNTRLYARKAVQLSIGEPPTGTIVVYVKLFEAMSPYLASGL